MKNYLYLLTLLIVLPIASGQSTGVKDFMRWSPEEGQWKEDPDAPGTYSKTVTGSASTGNWNVYVKVNSGARINWHWHRNSQTMYIVSGAMEYEVKPHPPMRLTLGSYVVVPAHALHNGTCVSQEPCTFFIENLLPNDKHMTDAGGNEIKRQ